jgi:pimeloyl-ACP methyl ester carboxylesterase
MTVDDLVVDHDGVALAGSLWWPSGPPRSLVIMHPGSGPSDRHNDELFPPIRAALVAAGHAVASFDKRGVGGSSGSPATAGIEQQAGDLLACAATVRERVGGRPVGAFGHSQGGWVVYEAASAGGVVDFAIANSGPGVSVLEQTRHALAVATEGHPDRPGALALLEDLADRARAAQPLAQVLDEVDIAAAGSLGGFATQLLSDEGEWRLTTLLLAYDPAASLRSITVPLVAVFGADDSLVPVDASVEVLRREVDAALLRVRVFEGAGHRLERSDGSGFVDGYLDALVEAVDAHAAG